MTAPGSGPAGIDLAKLVAETDLGGRNPSGFARRFMLGVALAWSLFQLWIASPLPFAVGFGVLNDTESRSPFEIWSRSSSGIPVPLSATENEPLL